MFQATPLTRIRFLIILLLLTLFACTTPVVESSPINQAEQPLPANALIIETSTAENISVNETFSATIFINETADLTALELHLSFDPGLLEVVELKNGGFVAADFTVQNTFDNAAGTIDYAIAQIGRDPAKGSGTILEIKFRAKGTGKSDILFRGTSAAPEGALLSDSSGQAIGFKSYNGQVVIK